MGRRQDNSSYTADESSIKQRKCQQCTGKDDNALIARQIEVKDHGKTTSMQAKNSHMGD
ncbi:MAG: hypothetical protein J6X49_04680 [Victivallales bacterium]|nr:hypothetical protein [Victivallales bacterium]